MQANWTALQDTIGIRLGRSGGMRSLWAVAVAILLFETPRLVAQYPDLSDVVRPVPEPAHPIEWDVFVPPVHSRAAAAQTPLAAEWSRTAAPGESIVATVHGFQGDPVSATSGVPHFVVFGQTSLSNARAAPGLIQRQEGSLAIVTLPSELPTRAMYLVWPVNDAGIGTPMVVNRTESWWLGPERAERGAIVSVYGRNLSHAGGTDRAWVYLTRTGFPGSWAAIVSANPYRVQFRLPPGLTDGIYQVWIHNGHGGRFGWSSAPDVTVVTAPGWTGDVFNVRTYGARGDGVVDDTNAIKAAYAAALAYRDRTGLSPTLYLPGGTYLMQEGLGMESRVRIAGDGMNQTTLRCGPAFGTSGPNRLGLLFANGGVKERVEISGLTLDADTHLRRPANQDHLVYCQFSVGTSDVRFHRVRIRVLVPEFGAGFFNNITRLSLEECEFVGAGVMLFNGRQHEVRGCAFYPANDWVAAIIQRGTSDVSVTQCLMRDYDPGSTKGQGLGRFIAGNGDYGSLWNTYIAENTTVDAGPRAGASDQNSGEHVMYEGNAGLFEGPPLTAGSTTVRFGTPVPAEVGRTATIVHGRGTGQSRRIVGFDTATNTFTVAPAWNVPPNSSSRVVIGHTTSRCVVYRNRFDGKADYATRYSATAGIQAFGGCHDWIGDGNTMTDLRIGIYVISLRGKVAGEPCFFHYYANNTLDGGYRGMLIGAEAPFTILPVGTGSLGHVFRRNSLRRIHTEAVFLSIHAGAAVPPTAVMSGLIWEDNEIADTPGVVQFDLPDGLGRNFIFHGNTFQRGQAAYDGSFGARSGGGGDVGFVRNTWSGFSRVHAGIIPRESLAVPVRRIEVNAVANGSPTSLTLALFNAGTEEIEWTAFSKAAWLKPTTMAGVMARDGNASFALTCDPRGLGQGVYLGVLELKVAGRSEIHRVEVHLAVNPAAAPGRPVISIQTW